MRRSVAGQVQCLSQQSVARLCRRRTSRCYRRVLPLSQLWPSGAAPLHSAAADSERVDANRAHKQTLTALSRARHAPASAHPAAAGYELVIGLEVHCQLLTATKLFSRASSAFGAAPNAQCAAVDAALPGALPHTVNSECVDHCIRTALCLHTEPQRLSRFDRKHYFYADMPQGYQITQQAHPVIRGGRVGGVRVDRVQLEQDSGKCLHDLHAHYSHVDLNRAGVPLIEVVTQPDMRSGEEAVAFVRQLGALLRHSGICRAQMEDGSLRCDVNVSVRRQGAAAMGERVEIKNLNSLRALHRAVQYEADRQIELCESGQAVRRETRTFDSRRGVSVLLRSKEQMLDYRFMAEPDLPWLQISQSMVSTVGRAMGETHDQQKERLVKQYGLSEYDARVLVSEQGAVAYFERLVHGEGNTGLEGMADGKSESVSARPQLRSPKLAVNWLTSELFGRIRRRLGDQQTAWTDDEDTMTARNEEDGNRFDVSDADVSNSEEQRIRSGGRREQLLQSCTVSSAQLASIIELLQAGRISGKTAKLVLDEMFDDSSTTDKDDGRSGSGRSGEGDQAGSRRVRAAEIVSRLGLWAAERDVGLLDEWVAAVLAREAEGVDRYVRKANSRFIGFLVGEVLRAAGGKADPKEAAVRVRAHLQQIVDASTRP